MLAREQKRRLEREDVLLMDLPVHFWGARFADITAQLDGDEGPLADRITAYFRSAEEHRARGIGLMIMGPNGVGKSTLLVKSNSSDRTAIEQLGATEKEGMGEVFVLESDRK